jgi:hypothetical protein
LYVDFIESHSIETSLEMLLNADINAARNSGFERLFLLIIEQNPMLGVEWVTKHGEDLFNPELAIQFGRILAGKYPLRAKDYLAKLDAASQGAGGIRSGILQTMAEKYSNESGAAYRELSGVVDKGAGFERWSNDIAAIVSGLQYSNNPNAFDEILKFISEIQDPEQRRLEEFQILGSWAEKDGPAAAKHAATLTGKLRSSGLNEVFSTWAKQNPKEAGLALLAIPSRDDRMAALEGYLPVLSKLSPEEAEDFQKAASAN